MAPVPKSVEPIYRYTTGQFSKTKLYKEAREKVDKATDGLLSFYAGFLSEYEFAPGSAINAMRFIENARQAMDEAFALPICTKMIEAEAKVNAKTEAKEKEAEAAKTEKKKE